MKLTKPGELRSFAAYPRCSPPTRGVTLDWDRLEWEPTSMSGGAKRVLDAFEQLPPRERDEVVVELLRRAASAPHESPSDDELLRAADDVFLELDRRES